MKSFIPFFIFFLSSFAYSQQDSALFVFKPKKDTDTRMLYDLLNIHQCHITCSDTVFRGKSIYLSIDEYKEGKVIKHDDFGFQAPPQKIAMVTGSGDTLIHIVDDSNYLKFQNFINEYSITMMGKYENDSLSLIIYLPGLHITRNLACNKNFQFRGVHPCGSSDSIYIPLNVNEPFIAFTPPFSNGLGSDYCSLSASNYKDWYKEFKIEHYYIFNLLNK